MRITFKDVVDRFIWFFNEHIGVNQVLFITEYDEQAQENVYPAALIVPQQSNVVNTEIDLNFNIFVIDLLNEARTNRKEAFNDMLSICQDFIAYFNDNDDELFVIKDDISLTPISEIFVDDIISGWSINVTIELPFSKDICDLPLAI